MTKLTADHSIPLVKISFFFAALLFACVLEVTGQGRGNHWYFGEEAAVKFGPGSPVALTDGRMVALEGCATISNTDGELLFYTDGTIVWNRFHDTLPNGKDLLGHPSSTMSGLFVPKPGDENILYLFTVDGQTGLKRGVHYSEIDLRLDGGRGDVTTKKNIKLLDTSHHEFLTATRHANGRDYWILFHDEGSDEFFSHLVSSAGVSSTPVRSAVAPFLPERSLAATGKISPNGKYLAIGIFRHGDYLYDFNNTTGKVSNPTRILGNRSYGIEFSPNSRFLYTKSRTYDSIFQFDLLAGSRVDFVASRVPVAVLGSIRSLQLAENGKIYFHNSNSDLSVIDKPNRVGLSCDVIFDTLYLGGKLGRIGLPAFIQSFFSHLNIRSANHCQGDLTLFHIQGDSSSFDSLIWNFGDPGSGSMNRVVGFSPEHTFSDSGRFRVCVVGHDTFGYTDTFYLEVDIQPSPNIELPGDTLLCEGQLLEIKPTSISENRWLWSDSSNDSTLTVSKTGFYWVETENECGRIRDSIFIAFIDHPSTDLPDEVNLCIGLDALLNAGHSDSAVYLWQDGSTDSTFLVSTPGIYSVKISNTCDTLEHEIEVRSLAAPVFDFTETNEFPCTGFDWELFVPSGTYSILWDDGSADTSRIVRENGVYSVLLENDCGSDEAFINVVFDPCCLPGIPNAFSPNQDGLNDVFKILKGGCVIEQVDLRIFNRYGQLVWSANSVDDSWDGTFQSKDQEMGVYLLTGTMQLEDGQVLTANHNIHLIR